MHIGEFARRARTAPKTVRYYEARGVLPEPGRDPNGYRRYTESDLQVYFFIKSAQRLGLSLDEIAEILFFHDSGRTPCPYVRERLQAQLDLVASRISELRTLEDSLIQVLAAADGASQNGQRFCGIIENGPRGASGVGVSGVQVKR